MGFKQKTTGFKQNTMGFKQTTMGFKQNMMDIKQTMMGFEQYVGLKDMHHNYDVCDINFFWAREKGPIKLIEN